MDGQIETIERNQFRRLNTRSWVYLGFMLFVIGLVGGGAFLLFGHFTVFQVLKNNDVGHISTFDLRRRSPWCSRGINVIERAR